MDPVTHGLIGLGISAFSGNPVALTNPVSLGCAIGAVTPDIDIIVKFAKDDYEYIRKHRGVTHSIPALAGFAFLITLGLSFVFTDMHFFEVFFWSFMGGVSHTVFDMLNSYGARLLRKKKRVSLLTLYDPIIWTLTLFLTFNRYNNIVSNSIVGAIFLFYIGGRYLLRERARREIIEHYHLHGLEDVSVLPGLKHFYKWDFIVRTDDHSIVGDYNAITGQFKETKKFEKVESGLSELFHQSNLGKHFMDWSPNYHLFKVEEEHKIVVRAVDLRYYFNNDFMHKASLEIDKQTNRIESFFHPYKLETRIQIEETMLATA